MIDFIVWFIVVIISISTAESISWAFTIAHHARWLKSHPDYERRLAVPPGILFKVSLISCSLSLISWTWFMHLMALYSLGGYPITYKGVFFFLLFFGIQVTVIFMWSIVSSFICLPGVFWPVISKIRVKLGLSYLRPSMADNYVESLKEWKRLNVSSQEGKSLIVNFLNNLPVIIWTKGVDRKYTYMSRYFYTRFGIDPYTSVIGRTGKEVAELIKSFDPTFEGTTFDEHELRIFSDEVQIAAYVNLIVKGEESAFEIVNVPMYRKGRVTGLIGIAADCTWEHNRLLEIHNLFATNRITEGIIKFEKFWVEIQAVEGIKEGFRIIEKRKEKG